MIAVPTENDQRGSRERPVGGGESLERRQTRQRELLDGAEGVFAHDERLQLRQRETQPGNARAGFAVDEEVLQHR